MRTNRDWVSSPITDDLNSGMLETDTLEAWKNNKQIKLNTASKQQAMDL